MKKAIIFTIAILMGLFLIYFTGALDYFDLRKNKVLVLNEAESQEIEIFFVSGRDTLRIFRENHQVCKTLPNWYGKDHVFIRYKDFEYTHHQSKFKFDHWRKLSYTVKIYERNQALILDWKLKSIWETDKGQDVFPL